METLTLEQLAPYLPYGLKCYANAFNYGLDTPLINEMDVYMLMNLVNNDTTYKIALRPLSDLTKEIEHNGERFVPINKILREIGYGYTLECYNQDKAWILNDGYRALCEFPYRKIKFLFELHFDVFGLIPKNLAIDINQIK